MGSIAQVAEYFIKGGFVMWPLLFCSIFVIAIAIERYMTYKNLISPATFIDNFTDKLAHKDMNGALALAKESSGACAQMMASVTVTDKKEEIEAFLSAKSSNIIAKFRKKLNYLNLVTTLAPLLGLLGTIIGMIRSFSIFDLKEGAPLAITGGIGEALIATATGLLVAILSLIIFYFFESKMDQAITDMEHCCNALLEAKVRGE